MPLTKSFYNGQKLLEERNRFLERKEVIYPVDTFGSLKRGDFSTVLSLSPLLLPPTSASLIMFNGKFLIDLVLELVLLPTSASSVLSINNHKFSADRFKVILSIKVSGPANLFKP